MTAIYVGSREDINYSGTAPALAAPYYLVNLDASYQLTPSVALFARIENLLNGVTRTLSASCGREAGVFGGLRVAFDAKAAP